jgi:hypothetical protein
MSFLAWCLTLLAIVAGLVGLVYVLWTVLQLLLFLLMEAWQKRRDLNPLTR